MERHEYMAKLNAWMRSPRRKPLILEGARQVGKTWLMREFAKGSFAGQVYVRFDRDRQLRSIFDRNFDVARIVHELEIAFKTRVEAGKTVLIFDEIQACKAALTSLKYFCEDRPDLHILCAGSLLGLEYSDDECRLQDFPCHPILGMPSRCSRLMWDCWRPWRGWTAGWSWRVHGYSPNSRAR